MAQVSVVKCENYEENNVRAALGEALGAIGGLDMIKPGMKVGIKVNLVTGARPEKAVTTHPVPLCELIKMLCEKGAEVIVGDSPGGLYTSAFVNGVYSVSGLKAAEKAGGKLNQEGYKSVAKQLADKFGFEKVAITLRTSISANDNDWAGMLYDGKDYCFSKSYHLHIVDRVGGGDSFGGGLIYALLNGKTTQQAIEFAVAASALKHTVEGDYNRVSVSEVEKLAGGDGSGRVQR